MITELVERIIASFSNDDKIVGDQFSDSGDDSDDSIEQKA